MKAYSFNSQLTYVSPKIEIDYSYIKNEPMLFNCDYGFAYENGGPITKKVLSHFPDSWKDCVVDSRVHMLMKGWFPCIPGFHHDDVPRTREDGQPNYNTPEYRSEHLMFLANGDICATEFAIGKCDLIEPPLGEIIYKKWHEEIENNIQEGNLLRHRAETDRLIYFNDHAFHQGTRAISDGWRFFLRASCNTNRKPTNEIRKQVQVYLEFPTQGW